MDSVSPKKPALAASSQASPEQPGPSQDKDEFGSVTSASEHSTPPAKKNPKLDQHVTSPEETKSREDSSELSEDSRQRMTRRDNSLRQDLRNR
jgi:hypothetical protein